MNKEQGFVFFIISVFHCYDCLIATIVASRIQLMIKAKLFILTFGRTRKFTPRGTSGGGGVGGGGGLMD